MSTQETAYEVAPAPKGARFTCFDCARCGHEELGKPVFLRAKGSDSAGTAYGSGCAALLLFGSRSAKAVRFARERQAEADAKLDRRLYGAAIIARLPAIVRGQPETAAEWHKRGWAGEYHRAGGFDVLGSFIDWANKKRDEANAELAAAGLTIEEAVHGKK